MNKDIIKQINNFTKERNWDQFHSGENLAKSLIIEASELLELFQWSSEVKNIDDLKDELADVLIYALQLAIKYDLDVDEIIYNKIEKNAKKYPIAKAKGNAKKYNEL